jgi:hypothetical protein
MRLPVGVNDEKLFFRNFLAVTAAAGFEPLTLGSTDSRSTNWAKQCKHLLFVVDFLAKIG